MGTAKQRKAKEGDCPTAKKAKLFEMGHCGERSPTIRQLQERNDERENN